MLLSPGGGPPEGESPKGEIFPLVSSASWGSLFEHQAFHSTNRPPKEFTVDVHLWNPRF